MYGRAPLWQNEWPFEWCWRRSLRYFGVRVIRHVSGWHRMWRRHDIRVSSWKVASQECIVMQYRSRHRYANSTEMLMVKRRSRKFLCFSEHRNNYSVQEMPRASKLYSATGASTIPTIEAFRGYRPRWRWYGMPFYWPGLEALLAGMFVSPMGTAHRIPFVNLY